MIRILTGDCRDLLATLPTGSVQCVVTSPPYYGLRDYGTGTWEGGSAECQHSVGGQVQDNKAPGDITTGVRPGADASKCRKCGAKRIDQQIGLEKSPDEYVAQMVAVFRDVRRVLRDDGTLWLNIGDSYAATMKGTGGTNSKQPTNAGSLFGSRRVGIGDAKVKDLLGIPWLLAFALRADGWYLRSDIIWHKPNPMPESVRDRPTSAHEHVFLLTKRDRYFYDADAITEDSIHAGKVVTLGEKSLSRGQATGANVKASGNGIKESVTVTETRNARNVWTIATKPFSGAHFATMPPDLVERCVKAGSSEKGCCAACGAPWARQTETKYENPGNRTTNGPRSLERRHETAGFAVRLEKRVATLGWQPSCNCPPAEHVPCVVLDPFGGAGTTGLVAQRLGRDAVLLELNVTYADMARTRINAEGDLALLTTKLARAEQAVEKLTRALSR